MIWRMFLRPSRGTSAHHRGATGAWHSMLGFALAHVAIAVGIPYVVAISAALALYALKEAIDLRRGGSALDGIEDMGFVAIGALAPTVGPAVFGASVMTATVLVAFADQIKRGRDNESA